MNSRNYRILYVCLQAFGTIFLVSGCASSPVDPKGAPILEPSRLSATPIQPYAETYPIANLQRPAPQSYPSNEEPVPVWENSQIQKVAVDAYVDENGNLHPRSYMYVVTKKGGWNLDAVRKPNNYIPPENAVTPINGFGTHYEKSFALQTDASQESVASLLLNDTSRLRITGLTQPQDGEAARSQIDPLTEVAVFDPYVGWIIAPKSAVEYTTNTPNVYREDAARATISSGGTVEAPNMGIRAASANPTLQIPPNTFQNPPAASEVPAQTSIPPAQQPSNGDLLFDEF